MFNSNPAKVAKQRITTPISNLQEKSANV